MQMKSSDLMKKIDDFISGVDTTLKSANAIEVALEEEVPDDEFIEEVVVDL